MPQLFGDQQQVQPPFLLVLVDPHVEVVVEVQEEQRIPYRCPHRRLDLLPPHAGTVQRRPGGLLHLLRDGDHGQRVLSLLYRPTDVVGERRMLVRLAHPDQHGLRRVSTIA